MKVVVLVRTRNEEDTIKQFCENYSFADKILVADAESTDKTVEIAKSFENVVVRTFREKVFYGKNYWRSYEPRHINFLINWAMDLSPDWLIYDDADCYPNKLLKENARKILEEAQAIVKVYRLYVFKGTHYFPDMNNAGKSLWAWKPAHVTIKCNEGGDPRQQNMEMMTKLDHTYWVDHPYVLLHNFARNTEHIEKKMRFYEAEGNPQLHPLDGCGRLERLPDYAYPDTR